MTAGIPPVTLELLTPAADDAPEAVAKNVLVVVTGGGVIADRDVEVELEFENEYVLELWKVEELVAFFDTDE